MIAVRRVVRGPAPRRSSSTRCSSARLGATHVSVGENFRFGHRAQGDPQLLRQPTSASRRASCRCSRSTARSSARATSAASSPAARSSTPGRLLGAPFARRRTGRARRQARPHARLPDREPGPARRATARRVTASTPAAPGRRTATLARRGASTSACARCSRRGRGELDRGLPAGLRRRPLRPAAAGRVPQAPARRAALRQRRRARRADGPRRRGDARGRRSPRAERRAGGAAATCRAA